MQICFNGRFYPANEAVLPVQNRSYKWGDGLFETMKVLEGRLLLAPLHFDRLFTGLRLLQIVTDESFTPPLLNQQILALCASNNCAASARVRLAVYRTDDDHAGYTIEATPLPSETNAWAEIGPTLCLYPSARKATDAFANLKSANYLAYAMAGRYAKDSGADDALVLNVHNRLCDSSRANLFLVKDGKLLTPALHEGCINGVMRRVVMDTAKAMGVSCVETSLTEDDLLNADEIFLTNAIQTIRWVDTYGNREYGCALTRQIFDAVWATILAAPC